MQAPGDEDFGHSELRYDPTESDAAWRDEVEAWEWIELDAYTNRKAGWCPRCQHMMTVDARGGTLTSSLPAGAPRRVLARCNCSANHKGHPERAQNDWGCGFRTTVIAPS